MIVSPTNEDKSKHKEISLESGLSQWSYQVQLNRIMIMYNYYYYVVCSTLSFSLYFDITDNILHCFPSMYICHDYFNIYQFQTEGPIYMLQFVMLWCQSIEMIHEKADIPVTQNQFDALWCVTSHIEEGGRINIRQIPPWNFTLKTKSGCLTTRIYWISVCYFVE